MKEASAIPPEATRVANRRWRWLPLRIDAQPPAASSAAYQLHLAAVEYSLATPITISGPEDIQSRKHWSELLEPYEHQIRNLLTFCRRAPVALIADDVGLGKTISAGLILSELMTRRKVTRALVICPKILMQQWQEELRSKFRIEAKPGVGDELELLSRTNLDVVVTTYHSARRRMRDLASRRFDMLILDEAHKLRNLHGTQKPPAFAQEIAQALTNRDFRYVLMLTATPIQNRLWDLYSLVDCLTKAKGHRNPLGGPNEFVARYIADGKTAARQVVAGRKAELQRLIGDYMVRMRRADCRLEFPSRQVMTLASPPSPAEQPLVPLLSELIKGRHPFHQVSLAQAAFSSPQALLSQVKNMARSGSVAPAELSRVEACVGRIQETGKLTRLRRIIAELRAKNPDNWRLIVFTTRVETLEMIRAALVEDGIFVGTISGGSAASNERTIAAFRAEPPNVNVVVSTDAGAEGINLQVANVLVNYDLPWNPMIVEQRIGRVQRLASKHRYVMIVNLVTAGTVEEHVVGRLIEKLELIASTIGDIESVLESSGFGEDDAFDDKIRDLVLRALQGQDVEAALRKAQASIDEAKRIYAEEQKVVEETIGGLDEMHSAGPKLPKLKQVTPRMTVPDFSLAALAADGAKVLPAAESRVRVQLPGRHEEVLTFDGKDPLIGSMGDGIFGGSAPILYDRDQPPFERLVGQWSRRHGHVVRDARGAAVEDVRQVIAQWFAANSENCILHDVIVDAETDAFQGEVVVRASASVAHDRYEKLVGSAGCPASHPRIDPTTVVNVPIVRDDIVLSSVLPDVEGQIVVDVERDPDIAGFCEFYSARCAEELSRAGVDPARRGKVTEHFTPSLTADVVGIDGLIYSVATVKAKFSVGGDRTYVAVFRMIPRTATMIETPAVETCTETRWRVPSAAMADCSVSSGRVLRDLLVASDASGRLALPQFFRKCDATQRLLLEDELGTSSVTGRVVDRSLLVKSAISDRYGLREELVRCDFTKLMVLHDEAVISDVSGWRLRKDEELVSAVSGKRGHASEFLTCEASGAPILADEGVRSAVSGRVGRRELMVASEKPPFRLGLPSEVESCAISNKRLLSDELAASAMSGIRADRDLLVGSSASQRLGLPSESVTCAESGARLLMDEVDRCSITGNVVSKALLGSSAMSGAEGLARLLVRCEETGRTLLPKETARCDVSALVVGVDQVERCVVTGKTVLKRLMVQDAIDQSWMVPEVAARSELSGRLCQPAKVVTCTWTGRKLLPDEVGRCALTGLVFEMALLADGEFKELAAALRRRTSRPTADEDLAKQLRWLEQPPLDQSRAAVARWNATHSVAAVRVELSNFLGFNKRVAGFMIKPRQDGKRLEVIGKLAVGKLKDGNWTRIDEH